mgnify:FL=1
MPGDKHKTTPFLTRFECARLLGMRVLQLSEQRAYESKDSLEQIATQEILDGENPATIRRYLPDGTHEDRLVRDLRIDPSMLLYQLRGDTSAQKSPGSS